MPSKTPTVGFVIDDLGHGGAQKQVELLAAALTPHVAIRVYVLSALDEPHGPALRALGIPTTRFARRSSADIVRLARVARAMAADRVDVVHGFLDAANIYAFLAGRILGKPTVVSLRSNRLMMAGVRARAARAILRRADAVTVNSEAGRVFLANDLRVSPARIVRVPNIAPVPAHTEGPPAHAPPLVGCVGRLVGLKRFDLVLRAFPLVRAAVPGARLEIVGDGPQRDSLQALARTLQLEDAVVFAGAVDDATTRIARMSCVVLTSEFEGLPNAALEAMGFGIPVVATPVGDVSSIVIDGSTGVIVRDTSAEPLAAAIVRGLTDHTLRARARVDAPRLLREQFSAEAALAALVPLYERLSKRTGAAAFEATTPVLGE